MSILNLGPEVENLRSLITSCNPLSCETASCALSSLHFLAFHVHPSLVRLGYCRIFEHLVIKKRCLKCPSTRISHVFLSSRACYFLEQPKAQRDQRSELSTGGAFCSSRQIFCFPLREHHVTLELSQLITICTESKSPNNYSFYQYPCLIICIRTVEST